MGKAICGLDCSDCWMKNDCAGCEETGGRPFGGSCMVAQCRSGAEQGMCGSCWDGPCAFRKKLADEFNALGIEDMEEVRDLNALSAAYVNLEYMLPGGQKARFWDDSRVILGNQLCKKGSDRCYGLAADENYLLVCEYGENGADPEIVVFKKRK